MKLDKLENRHAKLSATSGHYQRLQEKLGNGAEWEYRGEMLDCGKNSQASCACGHPVRYLFPIYHSSGKREELGSTCIEHYEGISPDIVARVGEKIKEVAKEIAAAKKARRQNEQDTEIQELIGKLAEYADKLTPLRNRLRSGDRLPYNLWSFIMRDFPHGFRSYNYVSKAAHQRKLRNDLAFVSSAFHELKSVIQHYS